MEQQRPVYEQTGVAMTCRSFDEYARMFDLPEELTRNAPLLDVAGGASSFTATARSRGLEAHACDPLYALTPYEIERHGAEEIRVSTQKLAKLADHYNWDYYGSLDLHRENRERSLQTFITNYKFAGREVYRAGTLPKLPYDDHAFGLVLCSHFLFLYADQFDDRFHEAAVRELLRVCRPGGEVRIYPLVSLRYQEYERLPALLAALEKSGVSCRRPLSKLPFLPNSSESLVLCK